MFKISSAKESGAASTSGAISIKLGSGSKSASTNAKNPKKRLHSTFIEGDHDAEENERSGKSVAINTFDQDGGHGHSISQKPPTEYIIPPQKNVDWRDAIKRKRNLLPAEEQARRNGTTASANNEDDKTENEPIYGLNIVQKATVKSGQDGTVHEQATEDEATAMQGIITTQTPDEDALAALLGKKEARGPEITRLLDTRPELGTPESAQKPEADDFRSDLELRPEPASMADYEAMPIEHFGSALLRSMGWKEGDSIGRRKDQAAVKPRVLERRPAGLGIGAKEINLKLEEPGAWGKGSSSTKKLDRNYVPLVLKNARTGETLTEAELQARNKQQEEMVVDTPRDRTRSDRSERHRREASPDRKRGDGSRRHRRDDSRDRQRNDESRRRHRDDSRERQRRDEPRRHHRDDSRERQQRRDDESRRPRHDRSSDRARGDSPRRHRRDNSRDRKRGERSRKHHYDRSPR